MTSANAKNYSRGRWQPIQFIVLHYTAGRNDTAANNIKYFKNNAVGASAHYFVDETGWEQSVDDGDTAWSVGTAGYYTQKHPVCRNGNSISIEMCCEADRYTIADETVDNAAELTRQLMDKYNIPLENVLRHWDVVNKQCPLSWVEDESKWLDFKERVKKLKRFKTFDELPDWAKPEAKELIDAGAFRGRGDNLDVTEDMLRVMIINMRYANNIAEELR